MTLTELNEKFGIAGQLCFVADASGLIIAEFATATLCLQGAHLMTWTPGDTPVIWLSPEARLQPGKAIRGGVPICWPWFGAHQLGAHGYARTAPWQVLESGIEPCGATRLVLAMSTESTSTVALRLTVIIGASLRMALCTSNTGSTDFHYSEALHAYFQVGDIAATRISGLAGCEYWDTVGGATLKLQADQIHFAQETDQVYINSAAECMIIDEILQRRIMVEKSGSLSTVVWTPWTAKAQRMGDLGQPEGWREMVCVESANAFENSLTLAPGCSHTLEVEYRVILGPF